MTMTRRRWEYPRWGRTINSLNILVWAIFLLVYANARYLFHSFDLTGFPFHIKVMYHLAFYVPLGVFLWRREFSVRNVATILLLLALVPEGYQYYLSVTVPLDIHLLDFSLNLAGGVVGICIGMVWTFREIIAK